MTRGDRSVRTGDRSCGACESRTCSAREARPGESPQEREKRQRLASRLCRMRHKIFVLSGKGGVGKSTVAANLAVFLARAGRRVGLLDVDIHGPSIPGMFGLEGPMSEEASGLSPIAYGERLRVMSIGLLLRSDREAVVWRGPMKHNLIAQFLRDVAWGDLDCLVVDAPPGTGDEPLTLAQLIPDADGAVIVTTPQEVALADVRRCVTFCSRLSMAVLGVVENQSGFVCPRCGETTMIFKSGGGEALAEEAGVPFLGRIPIDPGLVDSGDVGRPFLETAPDGATARAFEKVFSPLLQRVAAAAPGGQGAAGGKEADDDRRHHGDRGLDERTGR